MSQASLSRRAAVTLIAALCAGGVSGATSDTPAAPDLKIAVIPKGTTHVFWKAVERGARAAGKDLGVEIIWKGPLQENDRAQQIQLVQQFVTDKVSGIVLAPLDYEALAAPVKQAQDKKIPVVIFDSALKGDAGKDFVSFVATNSLRAGKLGGEHLAKLMGGKGSAVVLRYLAGSASTDQRENGCIEALKGAGIKLEVDNRYAGATPGEAKSAALNLMDQIKKSGGVFCPNESTTYGMLLALRQSGLAGKIKFVGFDSSPPLVEGLKKGEIDALVVQNPERMGNLAVTSLVKHLRGEKVEPVIDTGAVLVTRENMNEPEIKKLIE